MEIFTCTAQQALHIGEDIVITILEVGPNRVQLGIDAPGRRLTAITMVPLPPGSADLHLVALERWRGR